MSKFKFIRCERPDDILVVRRDFFENITHSIELGCKHPHLIIIAEDVNDLKFEDKEELKKMLDKSMEKNYG